MDKDVDNLWINDSDFGGYIFFQDVLDLNPIEVAKAVMTNKELRENPAFFVCSTN